MPVATEAERIAAYKPRDQYNLVSVVRAAARGEKKYLALRGALAAGYIYTSRAVNSRAR